MSAELPQIEEEGKKNEPPTDPNLLPSLEEERDGVQREVELWSISVRDSSELQTSLRRPGLFLGLLEIGRCRAGIFRREQGELLDPLERLIFEDATKSQLLCWRPTEKKKQDSLRWSSQPQHT